jgi:chaperonin GroES
MPLKQKPLLDRIFILQDEGDPEVAGLAIPESEKQKPSRGIVVAAGPGWYATNTGVFIPTTVKPGDHVIYNGSATTKVDIEGQEYICIKEMEILIVL